MSKISKFIIITILLILASCNRSKPTQPPMDNEVTQTIVQDTVIPERPTDTSGPEDTDVPPPTQEDPTPQPPAPLPQEIILEGEPISPLLAGANVDFKQVHMLNSQIGWGLATNDERLHHIMRTEDGGYTWRDITPPQPDLPDLTWIYPDVHFSDQDTGWVIFSHTDLVWITEDGGKNWTPTRLEFNSGMGGMIYNLDQDNIWLFQFIDGGMQKVNTALYKSNDGGHSWIKLLDPTMAPDYSIQGFDKTGVDFLNPDVGWLTRNFRGVSPDVRLDTTSDGGLIWQPLSLPAPQSAPNAFNNCSCGLNYPDLESISAGSMKLECICSEGGSIFYKNYIYHTDDGGSSWDIQSIPQGELHKISDQVYYVIGREIYRSDDGGENWDLMKTVNWDGSFSFVDQNIALGVAYDPDDEEYALVKTSSGCTSFEIIDPVILSSQTNR
jgi:hypothetical protein